MITSKSFFIQTISRIQYYGVSISGLFLLIITILSFIPVSQEPPMNNIDKIEHLIAYAALTIPISLAYHPRHKAIFWFACTWGMLIEIFQPYVGRQADTMDAIINAIGAGLGIIFAKYLFTLLCIAHAQSDE
tara:strand:- start:45 stop:440 length:396 start_codon:yes stop_codon:yes gene_type:complete